MRNLSIKSRCTVFPSEPAFRLLNGRFAGRCMFPNLPSFEWYNEDAERHLERILPLIVSPSLVHLELTIKDVSCAQAILPALAPAYDSLQSIYVTQSDSEPVQEFSTLLVKCNPRQLREFYVDARLSRATFLHAAQLPNLQFLGTKAIQADEPEPHDREPLPPTMFPSLQCLYVGGLDADSVWLKSFERIGSESLERLKLKLSEAATAWKVLYLTLAGLWRGGFHRTLTDLIIGCQGSFSGLEVNGTVIEHLLSFTQLTSLTISFICGQNQCGHKLSDEDLEKLVKAMPNLEYLVLGEEPCSIPAKTSIKSLEAIAQHCKHLTSLTIHTNVEAVIAGSFVHHGTSGRYVVLAHPGSVECPLHTITFGCCHVPGGEDGAVTFALTLLEMFPHLRRVWSSDETLPWKFISGLVTSSRMSPP